MSVAQDRERAGLCASCRHCQRITNARASTFFLCGLAHTDPNFARYPRLPVLACSGYAAGSGPENPED